MTRQTQQITTARRWLLPVALTALALSAGGCGGGGGSNRTPTATDLVGSWGGTESSAAAQPATLGVTATGGALTLPCGAGGTISQALTTDASGHFSATGSYAGAVVLPQPILTPAVFSGSVTGSRMTLTVTNADTQQVIDTYTLVKGQAAPPFTGVCPG